MLASSTHSSKASGAPTKDPIGAVTSRRGLRDITNATCNNGGNTDIAAKQQQKSTGNNKNQTSVASAPSCNTDQLSVKASDIALYRGADDIDARDSIDPRMATQYVAEIYSYLREIEVQCVDPKYTQKLVHVNAKMRSILIDWLVEVHQKFRCVPETLYLTINIMDRYLERMHSVGRSKLQLVGVTAFLIAAKYEEIYPPEIRDLVHIADKAYTKKDVLAMETSILNELGFKITIASTHNFLVRFLKAAHADRRMVWLACYITERTGLESTMLQFLPSVIASSSVWLARKNIQRQPWSPTLIKYTSYCEQDLLPCLKAMSIILATTTSLIAVKRKYSSQKFGAVSSLVLQGI